MTEFCFAELHTPHPEAAERFYTGVFPWTSRPVGADYWLFEVDGRPAAGMRRAPQHRWVPYVRTNAQESLAARATELGARVEPATRVDGIARTQLFTDAEGATAGFWAADGLDGTAIESGAGSLWWVELATADMAAAQAFYVALFDWATRHTMQFENGPRGYTLFTVGERSVAGAFQFEPDWGLVPAWLAYFEVADYEQAVSRACALGGEEGFARDVPRVGRIGYISDPGEALFAIAHPRPTSG